MENLIIKQDSNVKIRKGLGIFTFLIGIVWIIIFMDSHKLFDLLQFLLWVVIGIYHYTIGFGLEKSFLNIEPDGLMIKWISRYRAIVVPDAEIENICLLKTEIIINRLNDKPIRLKRNYLEIKQMAEIYKFFVEYSKIKNLTLIRDF